jgi:leucyl aminopeptidase
LIRQVEALELGRIVTRDIGGCDPERMSSTNIQAFVEKLFEKSQDMIKIEVLKDQNLFEKDYPCFAAVNRASVGNNII